MLCCEFRITFLIFREIVFKSQTIAGVMINVTAVSAMLCHTRTPMRKTSCSESLTRMMADFVVCDKLTLASFTNFEAINPV